MAKKSSVGVPGKVLHSQAREIVANVLLFMQEEAKDGIKIPLANYKERLLAATKIGEFSYKKVKKEAKEISLGIKSKFSSPKKNPNRPAPKRDLREGELESIRSIIYDFYIIEKRQPALQSNKD